MVVWYCLLFFPLSVLGGGGADVVGPLFILKVDPEANGLFLDRVMKTLNHPPSKSPGIYVNSSSP